MWQRHNAQLANFDVTSLRVIWVHYQRQQLILRKRSSYLACFITEGFFLSHVKRMRERPTRRAGDHQRVNAENKNDADEDERDA